MGQGTRIPLIDDLETLFPGLRDSGYVITSPEDIRYNCVAWAAGDEERWWWPDEDSYWPEGIAREETITAFVAAYGALGFVQCDSPAFEEGYEKIAISADSGIPTHVARQLSSGSWSSKLGQLQDIQHRLESMTGSLYGDCTYFLKRQRSVVS